MGDRRFQEPIVAGSRSWLITALAVVVVLSGSCGRADQFDPDDAARPQRLSFQTDLDNVAVNVLDEAAPRATGRFPERSTPEQTADGLPPLDLPILVATAVGTEVWSYPVPTAEAAPDQWFPNPTQFGGPRVFRVVDHDFDPEFVLVSLPSMPNGQIGWVKRDDVELSAIDHQVLVDLSELTVTVWHNDEVISDTRAVTGAPATPTPLGVFFVRDIIEQADATGSYGPFIVALSAFSETLTTFNGGLPAIAIHGTNNPSLVGQARSNGCVRVPNEIIEYLAAEVPLGTPVTIVM